MKKSTHPYLRVIFLSALALGLVGCASTKPKPTYVQAPSPTHTIAQGDMVSTRVEAEAQVDILPMEKQRFAERITERVRARQTANPAASAPRTFEIELTLTRYDKGNAFARAMLAGLGQIHIDGRVKVYAPPATAPVADFILDKTFAWGGIYGVATTMEDIETTFADGLAATLTGQNQPKEK